MGFYQKTTYKKDSNGKWKQIGQKLEKAPHDLGRWERSNQLEKSSAEYTTYQVANTRGGLNKKVVSAVTYFPDNTKEVRKLVTSSNKLPKSYRGGDR